VRPEIRDEIGGKLTRPMIGNVATPIDTDDFRPIPRSRPVPRPHVAFITVAPDRDDRFVLQKQDLPNRMVCGLTRQSDRQAKPWRVRYRFTVCFTLRFAGYHDQI
jgi:hypothetical protein